MPKERGKIRGSRRGEELEKGDSGKIEFMSNPGGIIPEIPGGRDSESGGGMG